MHSLIEKLISQGVTDFFLAPGSRSTPLTIAIASNPSAKIYTHFDERGLGFFALGSALAQEKPVAIVVTSGTAVGNLLPSIMEASHSLIPLILLTADRPAELLEVSANQATDQTKIFSNFVRFQFTFDETMPEEAIRSLTANLYQHSIGPAPGPVHLNCPFREPLYPLKEKKSLFSEPIYIEKINPICNKNYSLPSKGIILIGKLPKRSDLFPILNLAEKLKWPILADLVSNLSCTNSSKQIHNYDWLLEDEIAPDVVLHFGQLLTSKKMMHWLSLHRPIYWHISPFSQWIDPFHLITHRLQCEIESACNQFSSTIEAQWLLQWKKKDAKIDSILKNLFVNHDIFTESHLLYELSKFSLENFSLFLGNSMPIREANWFFHGKCISVFSNRGLSGIDGNIATIAGLGLHFPMIAIIGDLTTLHDLNSLSLLKKSPHPIILIISNNHGGGIFSHLNIINDPNFETLFAFNHNFSFKHIANQFEIPYQFLNNKDEIFLQINQKIKKNTTCIIEVQTSRKENHTFHTILKRMH